MFASYSYDLGSHYRAAVTINVGTVRIPFTVEEMTAPAVSSSAPMCDPGTKGPAVVMNWTSSNPGSSYKINRSTDGGATYENIATLTTSINTYTDKGDGAQVKVTVPAPTRHDPNATTQSYQWVTTPLSALTNYTYFVSTADAFGNVASSSPFSVTTLDCLNATTTIATTTIATTTPVVATSTPIVSTPESFGQCPFVAHSTLCPGTATSSASTDPMNIIRASVGACTSAITAPPLTCEIYCNSPFHPNGTQCSQGTTIEI